MNYDELVKSSHEVIHGNNKIGGENPSDLIATIHSWTITRSYQARHHSRHLKK